MGETSTRTLACTDCHKAIVKTGKAGPPPKRCRPCAKAHRSSLSRDLKLQRYRAKQATTWICSECFGEFPRESMTGLRKTCDECGRRKRHARQREARRTRLGPPRVPRPKKPVKPKAVKPPIVKAYRPKVSFVMCTDCRLIIVVSARSRRSHRCVPCAQRHRRAALRLAKDRARDARRAAPGFKERPARPCEGCAEMFVPFWKGPEAKWCKHCAEARGRAQRLDWKRKHPDPHRIAKRGLAAEVIDKLEIFERDGWRCGICLKRINKSLVYPHPMCGSLDHIVPVSQGGPHLRSNVRASHLRCNVSRGNRGGGEQLLLVG